MDKFCRIVARSTGDIVLGKNFGILEPGCIYEIKEFLGQLILQNIGPSVVKDAVQSEPRRVQICWGHNVSRIVESGDHLYTPEEYDKITEMDGL